MQIESSKNEQQTNQPLLIASVMRRAISDIPFKGDFLKDGDIIAQECSMRDDYTGKHSIELNKLIVQFNKKSNKWDVKCIDACVGYKNNFWGSIPRFDLLVGNIFDNPEMVSSEVRFEPYA